MLRVVCQLCGVRAQLEMYRGENTPTQLPTNQQEPPESTASRGSKLFDQHSTRIPGTYCCMESTRMHRLRFASPLFAPETSCPSLRHHQPNASWPSQNTAVSRGCSFYGWSSPTHGSTNARRDAISTPLRLDLESLVTFLPTLYPLDSINIPVGGPISPSAATKVYNAR